MNSEFDRLIKIALSATNAFEAEKCFKALVADFLKKHKYQTIDQAEDYIRDYLSYLCVSDHKLRLKVEGLYSCEHPYFGKAKDKEITASDAYNLGLNKGFEFLKELSNE